jgi:hypothetical protein
VLAREVASRLITGSALHDLGLGEVDGRTDLRGLWVVNPMRYLPPGQPPVAGGSRWEVPWATNVHWQDLDLSHTTLPICLWRSRVDRVRLDRAGLQAWRVMESHLADVSLAGANLDQASLDPNGDMQSDSLKCTPTTMERCDFSRAHMVNSPGFGRAVLTDCTFVNTRWAGGLAGMSFRGTSFRRCHFEGRAMTLEFGWTGPLMGQTPPWVEVTIPKAQAEHCYVHQVTGPGLVLV